MAGSRINRELECVKVLAGLDDVEDRLYVYTAAYRTPVGGPPAYEIEAILEICPESLGDFDLPVLPYAVHPLAIRQDIDRASPDGNAVAIRAKMHQLERANENNWFRFLQAIREDVLAGHTLDCREFIVES